MKFTNFFVTNVQIVTKIIDMYLLLQTSEHVKEFPADDIKFFIYKQKCRKNGG